MRLYFMRHGKAEPTAASDFERALTEKGAKGVQRVANVLRKLGVSPAAIYASPRLRAQQTAQIVAQTLQKPIITHEAVNFDFSVAYLPDLLQGMPDTAEVLFVGHNPSMSEVVGAVTGARVDLAVGAVACADVLDVRLLERGQLCWLLTPDLAKGG